VNIPLKVAIVRSGMKQRKVAWDAGLSDSRLSDIINEWTAPRAWERAAIASVLRREESELFPSSTFTAEHP
jgi:hypothetical protein